MLEKFRQYDDDGSERFKLVQKIIAYEESLIDAAFNSPERSETLKADDDQIQQSEKSENEESKNEKPEKINKMMKLMNLSTVILDSDSLPSATIDEEYEIDFVSKISGRYHNLSESQKEDLIRIKVQKIKRILDSFFQIIILDDDEFSDYRNRCIEQLSFYHEQDKETFEEYSEAAYLLRYVITIPHFIRDLLDKKSVYFPIEEDELKSLILLSLLDYQLILEEILINDLGRDPFFDTLEKSGMVGYNGNGKYYPKIPLINLCKEIAKINFYYKSNVLYEILVKGKNDSSSFNKQFVQRKLEEAKLEVEHQD